MILVYTTHASRGAAQKVTDALLAKKLIACTNYFATKSCFPWNVTIAKADEVVALYKTRVEHWDAICEIISDIHPDDEPCLLQIKADAIAGFDGWVTRETS